MEIITSTIPYQKDEINSMPLLDKKTLLFDIETTGFSASFSYVYLIGTAYYENESLHLTQFFAQNHADEKDILIAFMNYAKEFHSLLSYNGNGFDLPFLKAKMDHYHINHTLDSFTSIDLYRDVLKLKKILSLENYKQKTVELFLGLKRDDTFSGKELIKMYAEYESNNDQSIKELILLHNFDDIKGLFSILSIRNYIDLAEGKFSIADYYFHEYKDMKQSLQKELFIELQVPFVFPQKAYHPSKYFHISLEKSIVRLSIYLTEGTLKYFLPNYKDYYYLPAEDTAIHKSVASYVDKKYRTSAKASTCFVKKEGVFAPQFSTIIEPYYKKEFHEPISYFEIHQSVGTDELYKYILHLFHVLVH